MWEVRKDARAKEAEVFYTCMQIAVGGIAYVCGLQEGKSRISGLQWAQPHMYVDCSKVNHVQCFQGRNMSVQAGR
jgi:hypothetical protein